MRAMRVLSKRCLSSAVDRSAIRALAEGWIRDDPNALTRRYIEERLVADDHLDLSARLGKRLAFGTAGLRGPFGAGTSRMNDLVVLQTAQGLCRYLEAEFAGKTELVQNGVCIGYDHRAMEDVLSSKTFALITAAVFMSQGIKVHLYNDFVATPLVPFCVEQHGCAAGIMVTASHNPKEDDGYKVYWANGAQIIAPHDKGIEAQISKNLVPWKEALALLVAPQDSSGTATGVITDDAELRQSPLCNDPTTEIGDRYFQLMSDALCRHRDGNGLASSLPITYTAMHGVGHAWTSRSIDAFGLRPYVPVKEQLHPDPTFPTVPFPNPEEGEGALAMAFAAAEAAGSRLVIANDPDADRLAVAEQDPTTGKWRVFTGNEIGVLLGHWQWTQHKTDPSKYPKGIAMLASTVSSKMLGAVAGVEGFRFEETLTGFKWMGNRSQELRDEGFDVIFAFEEAIGFCVGDVVKDKDGVCAAAVFSEFVNYIDRVEGLTAGQYLTQLSEKYGYFLSNNSYFICHQPEVIDGIFEKIRGASVGSILDGSKQLAYPKACGTYQISAIRDLTIGYDSTQADQKAKLPSDPSAHFVTFTLDNGSVVSLRTSGTEPKLKTYIELKTTDPSSAQQHLDDLVKFVVDELLEPEANGLEFPQ